MATIEVNESNFQDTISKDGIVLIDCWASWCGPCRAFGPVFEEASEKHTDAVFGKLDTEANQGIAAALQIQSIPTLMIFRDNILVYREAGALPAAALENLIQQVKGLDMDDVRRQVAAQQENN
ncbi:thioredoxin [Corynebacterium pyruviciproducens]|uniref:thioredoxin n=1 Tax=Corynebacterium pyruviciproducens TaxID=598660 RepID=UPI002455D837|nr:thioredoxin [Corynebacterium pyruviciproducens]MDH4658078.1 thioredoxin [Corynebacterium pyruviciproducens]